MPPGISTRLAEIAADASNQAKAEAARVRAAEVEEAERTGVPRTNSPTVLGLERLAAEYARGFGSATQTIAQVNL